MKFTSRNLLILILVLQVVLISSASAWWWDKKEDAKKDEAAKKAAEKNNEVPGGKRQPVARRSQPQEDEDDDEQPARPSFKSETATERINRIKESRQSQMQRPDEEEEDQGQPASRFGNKRADLDRIREAAKIQGRIEAKQVAKVPPRRGYSENNSQVQGQGRRADYRRRRREEQEEEARHRVAEESEEDEDDDYANSDEADDDEEENVENLATKLVDRLKDNGLREHASTKFVSTKPKEVAPNGLVKPNLDFFKEIGKQKPGSFSGNIMNKLGEGKSWKKTLASAYKVTKKGLREGAKVISEVPKLIENGLDSINAFLQLDSKGKVLALMEEAKGDANFVRKEFSQFTLSWSPIMEKALNYLGDKDLNKIKWDDKVELDFRKDALNSLAFGYEFMRLMIIWRENLLVAHEAFKVVLESVKESVESKTFELNEQVLMHVKIRHAYLQLVAWRTIEEAGQEARTKLDYLMDVLNDRPKNYESDYFRNIIVLQEIFVPTIEEFDRERDQVVDSISVSGIVSGQLSDLDEFFKSFRSSLATNKIVGIDWTVPKQMYEFMEMLRPQLRSSSLIYTKDFLLDQGLVKRKL